MSDLGLPFGISRYVAANFCQFASYGLLFIALRGAQRRSVLARLGCFIACKKWEDDETAERQNREARARVFNYKRRGGGRAAAVVWADGWTDTP